jgi:hypothetical protein
MDGNKLAVRFLANLDQFLTQRTPLSLMPFWFSLDPPPFAIGVDRLSRYPILLPQLLIGKSGLF